MNRIELPSFKIHSVADISPTEISEEWKNSIKVIFPITTIEPGLTFNDSPFSVTVIYFYCKTVEDSQALQNWVDRFTATYDIPRRSNDSRGPAHFRNVFGADIHGNWCSQNCAQFCVRTTDMKVTAAFDGLIIEFVAMSGYLAPLLGMVDTLGKHPYKITLGNAPHPLVDEQGTWVGPCKIPCSLEILGRLLTDGSNLHEVRGTLLLCGPLQVTSLPNLQRVGGLRLIDCPLFKIEGTPLVVGGNVQYGNTIVDPMFIISDPTKVQVRVITPQNEMTFISMFKEYPDFFKICTEFRTKNLPECIITMSEHPLQTVRSIIQARLNGDLPC